MRSPGDGGGGSGKRVIIVVIICAVLIGAAVFNLFRSLWAYEEGNIEYSKVNEKYVSVIEAPVTKTVTAEEGEEEEEEGSPWTEDQSIPNLSVDHDALKAENPDYFCWLYVPSTGISYPVTKGEDNEYYLHHTFEKQSNINGCIFIDTLAWEDMDDYNTFVFGHNMRNGSMFGSLKQLLNEPEKALNDPYFYLMMKDKVMKYHIYAIHVTPPTSDTFHNPATEKEYLDYIDMVKGESIVDMGVDVSKEDRTVSLSTCSGTGAGKKRLALHGKLVGIIKTDGTETVSYNSVRALSDDI